LLLGLLKFDIVCVAELDVTGAAGTTGNDHLDRQVRIPSDSRRQILECRQNLRLLVVVFNLEAELEVRVPPIVRYGDDPSRRPTINIRRNGHLPAAAILVLGLAIDGLRIATVIGDGTGTRGAVWNVQAQRELAVPLCGAGQLLQRDAGRIRAPHDHDRCKDRDRLFDIWMLDRDRHISLASAADIRHDDVPTAAAVRLLQLVKLLHRVVPIQDVPGTD
jgi:hypothetical protein